MFLNMVNNLKSLISLKFKGGSCLETSPTGYVEGVFISPLGSVSELFDAYVADLSQGVFDCYENPHLGVFEIGRDAPGWSKANPCANTDGITNRGEFIQRVREIQRYIRVGDYIPNNFWFRAQDHGSPIIICDIYAKSSNFSHLVVNNRTTTEHIIPLIDARVEEGILVVNTPLGEERGKFL